MISIIIPVHNMPNKDFFMERCLKSIREQTYQDYEIVFSEKGGMAHNLNLATKDANGEIIKVLAMDDYLYDKNALKDIVDNFKGGWMVVPCIHDRGDGNLFDPHFPTWHPRIHEGFNTIGGISVLVYENKEPLEWDENLSWLIDGDYYKRLYDKYGEPTFLESLNVVIGIHGGQTTYFLSDEYKSSEHDYIKEKYGN